MTVFEAGLADIMVTNEPDTTAAVYHKLTDVKGWYGSTVETPIDERASGPGAFHPGDSRRTAKVMAVQGLCIGKTPEEAELAWEALAAVSPVGKDVLLAVRSAVGWRYMTVRVAGTISVDPFHPVKARFNIPLVSHDPRKLSAARYPSVGLTSDVAGGGLVFPLFNSAGLLEFTGSAPGGALTLSNAGKAPTYPIFTVTGGSMEDGFEVVEQATGSRHAYVGAVADGESIEIDTSTNRALSNGQNDMTKFLVQRDSMSVPGGEDRTFKFRALGAYTGDPRLTATMKDAWW